ncbi:MAG: response regulator, partial [Myxococcota bacterium]|nr:response regulator [Myxococcota bacterium]
PPAAAPMSQRVLVVDDNRDAAELLAEALGAAGHQVELAFDGPTAIEVAIRLRPHVAFLDIGLPVMDGYELARQLSRLEATQGTRLVAVTGYGLDRDRAMASDAGFDHHLVKPITLDDALALALPGAPSREGAPVSDELSPAPTAR